MDNSPDIADQIKKDLERDVYCLLGIPVDNMTIESTKVFLHSRTAHDPPAVWATINVNWVVQSFRDKEFRKAIINSDLVTLDGKPLLWLSKLLGYPMSEVVPGSTMIQRIHEDIETEKKLSIFFFGGEEDVGSLAMEKVNSKPSGLKAVGAINPGFGTVEEMSNNSIIEKINRTKPDILLVALGAKKGTAWIKRNREQLNAKIISHLGATVNFLAGTVRRAPVFFQVTATEWLWRILQEPKLFARYVSDGLTLTRVVSGRFFVWCDFLAKKKQLSREQHDAGIIRQENTETIRLIFGPNLQTSRNLSVQFVFHDCAATGKDLVLDFGKTKFIDGSCAAYLLLLEKIQDKYKNKIRFVNVNSSLQKSLDFL